MLKDYEKQKKLGLNPVFYIKDYPDFPKVDCWQVTREEALKKEVS